MNFNPQQLRELAASAILSQIAELNISALTGDRALDEMFYALPLEERTNTGKIRQGWWKRYRHIREDGGLAFFGVDPLTGDRRSRQLQKSSCTRNSPSRRSARPANAR